MDYNAWAGIHVTVTDGVATVTLDHPPLNLMDGVLLPSLRGFVHQVRADADVRVIVFQSADPEFFSAHGDMAYVTDPQALPAATQAAIDAAPGAEIPEGMNILEALSEEVRSLPQVTIGKLAGLARGAGNEFLMALDLRFAAIGRSGQAQPEAHLAIVPGGGGTLNLTRLVGRARALELLVGGQLVGAEVAERYGLVNRALPADEIDEFVDTLARRMAKVKPDVVAALKTTVETVAPAVPHQAYAVENASLYSLFTEDMVDLAHRHLAAGVQTREGELNYEAVVDTL
ncbi:enoyl-CoA hydratase/isomerase family protein [Kineosporia babensis]|uniref:Enoyl-CoA hydratase/isomerase family protein n=1 Tax=Kineosporia babensis TaxID=499548 RepID=A0A9X1NI68_9ACTN|nr:enoyl-CoA hydratase/isomerase family protein [Kineosporia babensis]MCD5314490.1 enoyl-CoA hydratase/isomerase family protein [Kineosporia babensis]